MDTKKLTRRLSGWRQVLAFEIILQIAFGIVLWSQGAPAWAITLMFFIASRSSKVAVSANLGVLQTTIKIVPEKAADAVESMLLRNNSTPPKQRKGGAA